MVNVVCEKAIKNVEMYIYISRIHAPLNISLAVPLSSKVKMSYLYDDEEFFNAKPSYRQLTVHSIT